VLDLAGILTSPRLDLDSPRDLAAGNPALLQNEEETAMVDQPVPIQPQKLDSENPPQNPTKQEHPAHRRQDTEQNALLRGFLGGVSSDEDNHRGPHREEYDGERYIRGGTEPTSHDQAFGALVNLK
jgi:hypothetical protein